MKLQDFAILADENIEREVVAWLRQRECDVLDVCEAGLIGCGDAQLIERAHSQNRVILTHDSDFGALWVARREPMVGLLFLRPGHIDPQFTIGALDLIFRRNLDLVPPFILVARRTGNRVTIRLRNL